MMMIFLSPRLHQEPESAPRVPKRWSFSLVPFIYNAWPSSVPRGSLVLFTCQCPRGQRGPLGTFVPRLTLGSSWQAAIASGQLLTSQTHRLLKLEEVFFHRWEMEAQKGLDLHKASQPEPEQ